MKTAPVGGQRVRRSGKNTVVAQLTIDSLRHLMPEVIPGSRIDTNREVSAKRCEELATYYINNADRWILPPVLVDSELDLEFISQGTITVGNATLLGEANAKKAVTIDVGVCQIPTSIKDALVILDGQHRIGGLVIAFNRTEARRLVVLDELSRLDAQEMDILQQGKRKELAAELEACNKLLDRFSQDTITVEIKTGTPLELHKEWFVTIADNAKGINKSERARLDTVNKSSAIARAIRDLHPLLAGEIGSRSPKDPRVDERNNQAKKASDSIYSLDNVRNVVKNIAFSPALKESAKRERSTQEESATKQGMRFFDILCDEIDQMKNLLPTAKGNYTGKEFRKETLYSSPTMLRSLAGAYHNLALTVIDDPQAQGMTTLKVDEDGVKKFIQLIRNLNPHMKFTVKDGALDVDPLWRKTKLFRGTGIAPQSGFQDLSTLVALLTEWGKNGKVFDGTLFNQISETGN